MRLPRLTRFLHSILAAILILNPVLMAFPPDRALAADAAATRRLSDIAQAALFAIVPVAGGPSPAAESGEDIVLASSTGLQSQTWTLTETFDSGFRSEERRVGKEC